MGGKKHEADGIWDAVCKRLLLKNMLHLFSTYLT